MKAKLAKTSIFLFCLYLIWYREAFGHVSLFLYGGTALVVGTTLLYVNHRPLGCLIPPKGLICWAAFGVYSLITGLVVASSRSVLVSSIVTYMAFLFVCYCAAIICKIEKDIYWILNVLLAVCYVCAVYTIFFGQPFKNGVYVTTMGPENTPNGLGVMMLVGMFAVLYRNERKLGGILLTLVTLILFMYVVILTGSRKFFVGAIILILLWIVPFLKNAWRSYKKTRKSLRILLALAVIVIGISYFMNSYVNTASFQRMLTALTAEGTTVRNNMYKEAFELFKDSPLFGIGFNQFRVLSSYQTYSHSTYAEVLVCGGVFGCLLFFVPIVWTGYKIAKKTLREKTNEAYVMLALYLAELAVGTVSVYAHTFMHMLLWAIFFIWVEVADISKPGRISERKSAS